MSSCFGDHQDPTLKKHKVWIFVASIDGGKNAGQDCTSVAE